VVLTLTEQREHADSKSREVNEKLQKEGKKDNINRLTIGLRPISSGHPRMQ